MTPATHLHSMFSVSSTEEKGVFGNRRYTQDLALPNVTADVYSGDEEILKALAEFEAVYTARDLGSILKKLDAEISNFGTGSLEHGLNLEDFSAMLEREIAESPAPLSIHHHYVRAERLNDRCGLVHSVVDIRAETTQGPVKLNKLRLSMVFAMHNADWKVRHIHFSMPYQDQQENESFPLDALEARNRQLEDLVLHRTAQLQKALEEKETLLKEIHHRVKNNMGTIGAFLSLQAAELDDSCAGALQEAVHRVSTMGELYDLLFRHERYVSTNVAEYLHSLIDGLSTTMGFRYRNALHGAVPTEPIEANDAPERDASAESAGVKTVITCIEPLTLPVQMIYYIGILANELITNAIKHAYQHEEAGTIWVRFKVADNDWVLDVEDYGDSVRSSRERRTRMGNGRPGFGAQLIEILVAQLGARIETIELTPRGKLFRVSKRHG